MKFSAPTGFWRFWAFAMVTFCLALTVTACNPQGYKTQAARVPQIIDTVLSDPKSFNYALINEDPNVTGFVYVGLINENALTGQLEPELAEKWEISPDKKRVTFTLREGLKWSDGQPLTSDDVVFTFQDVFLNPKIPTDIQDVLRIGKSRALPGVRKIDDRRVEFTTPEPFAPFVRVTGGLGILPKHILEETVKNTDSKGNPLFLSTWGTDTDPKKVVGNGPYTIDQYVATQRVIFKRNPNYWRKDAQGNQQPFIERIIWSVVENQNTILLQFRSGGLDISEPIRPEDFPILKKQEKQGDFTTFVGGIRPVTTFMAFNLNQGRRNGKPVVDPVKSKWFNNPKFRQAIAYGIDRERMNTNIFRGLGGLINSTIIESSPYHLSPEQGLKVYNFDQTRSKELLKEAGFRLNDRGQLTDAEGNAVRFTLMTNAGNVVREAMVAQIKQDLSQLGIQVDINPINFGVLIDKLDNTQEWESYLLAMGGSKEPNSGANVWLPDSRSHSFNQSAGPGKPPLEGRVVADWEAEIGRLYVEGAQELDETKRKQIYGEIQKIAQEYLPWIPLVNARVMAVVRNRVQGVNYPETGGALWNLHELRVED
ncbi:ABC transporter substrate-binding protein [Leptolyngbya sp. AN03gr2]|uniref:ABC transporter substrate-binding protein n=1 Tax=unclassified Leptolyngbya TaxID=2650499 RepID=UPI003D31805D